MDVIQIRGLKAQTVIGVHAFERKLARPLLIDLELATDAAQAAKSDSIKDAIDYQAISNAVIAFIEQSSFQLIETLAEKLALTIQKDFKIRWLRLTVHKPGAVPAAQDISVTIERGSRS